MTTRRTDAPIATASTHMPEAGSCALHRWCAALALLAVGCVAAPPTLPAVEEDGKALWQRVETEHFVVESNAANEQDACRVARDLETLWHAFARVPILGMRPPSAKPLVVVLRSKSEFQYLAGEAVAGYFLQHTALGALIVLPPHSGLFRETVVKHELAHFVSSDFLPDAPQWLGEGLAQVMETASYDTRASKILFGVHSENLVDGASARLPTRQFTASWPERMTLLEAHYYYGRSWLLVHYLIDNELQPFLNFLVRVSKGEDWTMAWQREQLPRSDEIDAMLEDYYRRAWYGIWKVIAYAPDTDRFEATPVPTSDSLALRSVLLTHSSNPDHERDRTMEEAEQDLKNALAADPKGERALQVASASQKARD